MSATASRSRSRSTVSTARRLHGHVDSLSPASGLEFALLPPDNATGNFTKIVQRVPVKIVLDDQRLKGLLRPGMSAVPTVNTKATVLAERETKARLVSDTAATRPKSGKGSCPVKIINPRWTILSRLPGLSKQAA